MVGILSVFPLLTLHSLAFEDMKIKKKKFSGPKQLQLKKNTIRIKTTTTKL